MKLEKLSAIAELVSSIAIVVTLAYLAIQTQQNSSAINASVRQSMIAEETQLLLKQVDYPFLVEPFAEGREPTGDQIYRYQAWLTAFVRVRESHWLQYQAGVIDDATWNTYRMPLRLVLGTDEARAEWALRSGRGEFAQGFVDDINEFLSGE